MTTSKHKVPASGSLEAQPVTLCDKEQDDGPRKYKMTAYTGAIFDIGFGPAVVEIASLQIPADGIPTLRQHNMELFIGRSDEIERGPPLLVGGTLFDGVDEADEVARISDQGGKWQASIGFGFSLADKDIGFVKEGETQSINGLSLAGPFLLLKNATLREDSFVPLGADPNTSAVALGDCGAPVVDEHLEVHMSTPNSPSLEDEQKRVADISSAFASDPKFALEAITGKLSLVEAKALRGERLEAKMAEQTAAHTKALEEQATAHAAELAAAKKAAPASPAAALSEFSPGGDAALEPADAFEAAVAKECKILRDLGSNGIQRGGSLKLNRDANIRGLAVQRVVQKYPEIQQAYLEAHNANVVQNRRGR